MTKKNCAVANSLKGKFVEGVWASASVVSEKELPKFLSLSINKSIVSMVELY